MLFKTYLYWSACDIKYYSYAFKQFQKQVSSVNKLLNDSSLDNKYFYLKELI